MNRMHITYTRYEITIFDITDFPPIKIYNKLYLPKKRYLLLTSTYQYVISLPIYNNNVRSVG